MRRGARTGRGGLALDNVFRRLLVASLQHRLAPRIWGLDLRWTGPKEPFLSCVSCGICQRKGQTQLVARFWLDAKLRKRHFDFGRLSILARRIVPCPTSFSRAHWKTPPFVYTFGSPFPSHRLYETWNHHCPFCQWAVLRYSGSTNTSGNSLSPPCVTRGTTDTNIPGHA